jgi:hypothetical protein
MMGPTSIFHAGEAGLTTVVEGMAKAREALPDTIREAADRRLRADSTLGKGVLAMVDTVAEESAKARATKAALAAEAAAVKASAAAEEKALALVGAAESAAKESGGRGGRIVLGGLALGAAAGGAYFVWKRRQQAANDHLSGVGEWGSTGGGTVTDLSEKSSAAAADVAQKATERASEVADQVSDQVSDQVADQVADSTDDSPAGAAAQATDAAQSFDEQIDEVADSMASDVVDAIETPKKGVKGM